MYPWHEALSRWSDNTKLHIDALGLVTLLGAEDINESVGRLVQSHYFDTLPLFGAYVIAGNHFVEKESGYALYNISSGVMTTELAAWFSRWLRAQDLRQVRSIVKWTETDGMVRAARFWVGFVLVGLPLNGMLVALTVLSDDWWGFANAIAMIASILVRFVLVSQNRAGVDVNVKDARKAADKYMADKYPKDMAEYEEKLRAYEAANGKLDGRKEMGRKPEPPQNQYQSAKAIVIRNDAKVITLDAPEYLIRVFAINPQIPNHLLYTAFQWIGWIAFAVHIISIGMSALPTQIYTVILLGTATVLNVSKVGCDDSTLWRRTKTWGWLRGQSSEHVLVSSRLQASFSEYPEEHCFWGSDGTAKAGHAVAAAITRGVRKWWPFGWGRWGTTVIEGQEKGPTKVPEKRQDLFAWLDLNEEEEETMKAWNLFPRKEQWWDVYRAKKEEHRERVRNKELKVTEMEV